MTSAPHEKDIELFVELLPSDLGVLTPLLWELAEGDSVTIRTKPKGIFTFDSKYRNHFLVATVTGVVPYVSFIRDYLHYDREGHRFYVLVGASYQDEHAYIDELDQIAGMHSRLVTHVPTVSRPDEARNLGWPREKGRVNLIIERYAEQFGLKPDDTLVYACGNPDMIEDVKARMAPKGFTVKEERFWKED